LTIDSICYSGFKKGHGIHYFKSSPLRENTLVRIIIYLNSAWRNYTLLKRFLVKTDIIIYRIWTFRRVIYRRQYILLFWTFSIFVNASHKQQSLLMLVGTKKKISPRPLYHLIWVAILYGILCKKESTAIDFSKLFIAYMNKSH